MVLINVDYQMTLGPWGTSLGIEVCSSSSSMDDDDDDNDIYDIYTPIVARNFQFLGNFQSFLGVRRKSFYSYFRLDGTDSILPTASQMATFAAGKLHGTAACSGKDQRQADAAVVTGVWQLFFFNYSNITGKKGERRKEITGSHLDHGFNHLIEPQEPQVSTDRNSLSII
ncbi:hypothetical protein LXL04_025560 [Taraxacum kok-saghyz]